MSSALSIHGVHSILAGCYNMLNHASCLPTAHQIWCSKRVSSKLHGAFLHAVERSAQTQLKNYWAMQTRDILRENDLQGAVQTVKHVSSVVLILQVPPRTFQLEGDQTGNRCRMQAAGGGAHMLSRKISYKTKH